MQETGDSQWRTVLQSLHRWTPTCFPLKQVRGEGDLCPNLGGGVFSSREAQGLSAGRGRLDSQVCGLRLPLLSSSGHAGRWESVWGAPWLAYEEVRPENVPLSLSDPRLPAPRGLTAESNLELHTVKPPDDQHSILPSARCVSAPHPRVSIRVRPTWEGTSISLGQKVS